VSQKPFINPYLLKASNAYSEQLGWNLQEGVRIGEIKYLYALIKEVTTYTNKLLFMTNLTL
jgi:hypothetical protein